MNQLSGQTGRIAVCGYGIAGAATAILLSRKGHDVTLVEQAPDPDAMGAGIMLQPSGQWVLSQMGLLDGLNEQACVLKGFRARTHLGDPLIRLNPTKDFPGHWSWGMHRGDIFTRLKQEVDQMGITIKPGHRILGFEGTFQTGFSLATSEGSLGPFDFLVVADGGRSTLRGLMGVPHLTWEYRHGAYWKIFDRPPEEPYLIQGVKGTDCLVGLLPTGPNQTSFFVSIDQFQRYQIEERGIDAFKKEVGEILPETHAFLNEIHSFDDFVFTTYRHCWMKSWWQPGICFLGDAAHAMSPHLGQGVNLALEDAWWFSQFFDGRAGSDFCLNSYERYRRRKVRFYALVTAFLTPFFQGGGPLVAWLRNLALPLMIKVPPLRRLMAGAMFGIRKSFWSTDPAIASNPQKLVEPPHS